MRAVLEFFGVLAIVALLVCLVSWATVKGQADQQRSEMRAATARAQVWNDFADEHGLEHLTIDEARKYEDRDLVRAMLAVKAHLNAADLNEVAPPRHWETRGKSRVEVEE